MVFADPSVARPEPSATQEDVVSFQRVVQHPFALTALRTFWDLWKVDRPVVAGPWLAEVGFEVLYWLPLLRYCARHWPGLRRRLVVVSRGGVAGWYSDISPRYIDIFDHFDFETFATRQSHERTVLRAAGLNYKQLYSGAFEREILSRVEEMVGPFVQLHPAWAYEAQHVVSRVQSPLPRWPIPPRPHHLPPDYVAVRFYKSTVFRGKDAQRYAIRAIAALAEKIPVVLLNTGMPIDPSHPDFDTPSNVVRLMPEFRTNLAEQTAAIAHARAFVGTYGGLSYVPPHYGVPTFALWSHDKSLVKTRHLKRAQRAYGASYRVEQLPEIPGLVQRVLQCEREPHRPRVQSVASA